MLPARAATLPPETGESSISSWRSARRASSARAASGGESGAAEHDGVRSQLVDAAVGAEQGIVGLGGVDDENHQRFKAGGELGGAGDGVAAGLLELGMGCEAELGAVDLVALGGEVEGGAHAHRA